MTTQNGTTGDDTLTGTTGSDTISGDAGNDSIDGGAGDDSLVGGSGNDTIEGGDGYDQIEGGEGDDAIYGGSDGNYDDLYGGAGNDSIYAGDGSVNWVYGGDGNDNLFGGANQDDLNGDAGDDTITANGGDDSVYGGDGFDTIYGGDGADMVSGGADNDEIYGGANDDYLKGGAGNDTIEGGDGNDTIQGEQGNDTLSGNAGDDTFKMMNMSGTDSIDGGIGQDRVRFLSPTDVSIVYGVDQVGTYDQTGGDAAGTFRNIEIIETSGGNDTIDATSSTSGLTISTADGDDSIASGSGNDVIDAGDGNDFVDGGNGADTIYGGLGADTIRGASGDDRIEGGAGNDRLFGGSDNDIVYGGDGDDFVSGGSGDDTLYGDAGNDTLTNGFGSDQVFGGAGDDEIDGGEENDSLFGGTGSDTFVIDDQSGTDAIAGGEDVGDADTDTLDLSTTTSLNGADVTFDGDERGTYALNATTANGTFSEIEQFRTTDQDDTVNAAASGAAVSADLLGGNDSFMGGSGADVVDGGAGNDELDGGFGNDSIAGGIGDDTIDGSTGNDTMLGEAGNDKLWGGFGNDTIYGGEGDDTLDGLSGDDLLVGGAGNDGMFGGFGQDILYGGSGTDTLYGGGDNDTLIGGAAGDVLDGGSGDDTLYGDGANNDPLILLNFEGGTGTVAADESGNGFDGTYTNGAAETGAGYTGEPGDQALQLDGVDDYVEIPADDAFRLENGTISVRFNADSLSGTSALFSRDSSYFDGGGHVGAWVNSDGSLEVRLQSDSSDTTLKTSPGAVSVGEWTHVAFSFGAEGATLYLNGEIAATDPYTGGIEGNSEPWTIGTNQRSSSDGVADNLKHFFDGRIDEFALFDTQVSQAKVSEINETGVTLGSGGADVLTGGDGNDNVFGGDGADTLSGGADNDTLTGGIGDDTLTGGTGEDVFSFAQGSGNDVVTDFDVGDTDGNGLYNDQLDVSGLQNPDGSPIKASNVTVVDDGFGNAKLIFPEGESVVLQGVTPAQMSTSTQLNAAGIPCFTPGTLIATPIGEQPIETLQIGDRVFTRDHGFQPIRWIGRRVVRAEGRFAPIRIQPSVATGLTQSLLVSPQHRMLFSGYRAELLFGETEVFVAASHLVDDVSVTHEAGGYVTYLHLMFDGHEVVYANGAATESFHPGDEAIAGVDDAAREELFSLFPELRSDLTQFGQTARRCLRRFEAEMLRM